MSRIERQNSLSPEDFQRYGHEGILSKSNRYGSENSFNQHNLSGVGYGGSKSQVEVQTTKEESQLIRQLSSIGINVFEYCDVTNQDRNKNIKVRDVIQIYRIFNNLRDSGDDKNDEIKLSKLESFPFFKPEDFRILKAQVYSKSEAVVGSKSSMLKGPPVTKVVMGGQIGQKKDEVFIKPLDVRRNKRIESQNSEEYFSKQQVDESRHIMLKPEMQSSQSRVNIHTKIESGGVKSGYGNCTSMICTNQNDIDSGTAVHSNTNSIAHNFEPLLSDSQVQNLGKYTHEDLKVSFKQFFNVMAVKFEEQKNAQEDIIFEEQEKTVSCFFW